MSAFSTLCITRSTALKLYLQEHQVITDRILEEFMDKFLESKLYNCIIVNDDTEVTDDNLINWYIDE
jgi:hypothetical protein